VQLHYILIKRNIYRFKAAAVVSQTPEENTNLNLCEVNVVGWKEIKILNQKLHLVLHTFGHFPSFFGVGYGGGGALLPPTVKSVKNLLVRWLKLVSSSD
jgi:hypothetical protein